MTETIKQTEVAQDQRTVPDGFVYNDDVMAEYDEQIEMFLREQAYQNEPVPSFEDVPTVAIQPTFNPSGALPGEIYGPARSAASFGGKSHAESRPDQPSVEMWRIVETEKLKDGTAMVSSRLQHGNTIGEVALSDLLTHLASNHETRAVSQEKSTPYISFSTDPLRLATWIAERGFGVKDGRNSVVTRVRVDSSRVLTHGRNKEPEVLLMGGVAPDEYLGAYEVADFVQTMVPEGKTVASLDGRQVGASEALAMWARPPAA